MPVDDSDHQNIDFMIKRHHTALEEARNLRETASMLTAEVHSAIADSCRLRAERGATLSRLSNRMINRD